MAENDFDVTKMSDEELEAFINDKDVTKAPPGAGAQTLAARNAAVKEKVARTTPKTTAEEIEPSAWKRGMAAMGGRLQEPFVGLAEKFQLAFPGASPEVADETNKRIGQERAERRAIQKQLEDTPAGQVGGFIGRTAPFLLVPPKAGAQAGLAGALGFLSGGSDQPKGIGSELATSASQGAIDAAVTGTLMKGAELVGKGISGTMGKYTPMGEKAMELDASAKRLGLPSPTIGQLDPLAPSILRAHPELAQRQAAALEQRMNAVRKVPNPNGGVEDQIVPGGAFKSGLVDAINARKSQASDMYAAVDDYIRNNNLSNITPNYTLNTLSSIAKRYTKPGQTSDQNRIFRLFDSEDPQAFDWLKQAGSISAARKNGMDFSSYQNARTLVNGVLTDLRAIKPANRKNWQNQAIGDLEDLIKALDNDAERWATANKDNQEAVELFKRAKEFYRTVAAPTTQNEVARKIALPQSKGGYGSIERMYEDVINPSNQSLIDLLLPTASRETKDTLNVMRNLPDVGQIVAKSKIPTSAERSGLSAVAAGVTGHPFLATLEYAPGLRWLSSLPVTKRVYFGAPPTSPVLGPSIQYPAQNVSSSIQNRLGLPDR